MSPEERKLQLSYIKEVTEVSSPSKVPSSDPKATREKSRRQSRERAKPKAKEKDKGKFVVRAKAEKLIEQLYREANLSAHHT